MASPGNGGGLTSSMGLNLEGALWGVPPHWGEGPFFLDFNLLLLILVSGLGGPLKLFSAKF